MSAMTKDARKFEVVPRVLRCAVDTAAVVFFHSSDNPFGNPRNVFEQMKAQPAWFIKERFYGVAHREITQRFPRFGKIHIVRPEQVPLDGTNYLFMDPCGGGRNFAMAWVRFCEDDTVWFYREWPSQVEEVPGYGFLGPWAEPGNGAPGERDGKKGPGQRGLGLGLTDYKKEIARLERWPEYAAWMNGAFANDQRREYEIIGGWREPLETRGYRMGERGRKGAPELEAAPPELVFERYMDSRYGNQEHASDEGVETLITEFADLGLIFHPTSAEGRRSIDEGVELVNKALAWNAEKPVDFCNRPRVYFSENCKNLIWAMKNWTGADGLKGASKDFVDLVRYPFLKGCRFVGDDYWHIEEGGSY